MVRDGDHRVAGADARVEARAVPETTTSDGLNFMHEQRRQPSAALVTPTPVTAVMTRAAIQRA